MEHNIPRRCHCSNSHAHTHYSRDLSFRFLCYHADGRLYPLRFVGIRSPHFLYQTLWCSLLYRTQRILHAIRATPAITAMCCVARALMTACAGACVSASHELLSMNILEHTRRTLEGAATKWCVSWFSTKTASKKRIPNRRACVRGT